MPYLMITKYPGSCQCGARVQAGARVQYDREQKPAIRECPACSENGAADAPDPAQVRAIRVQIQRVKFARKDGSFSIAVSTFDRDQDISTAPYDYDMPFDVAGAIGEVQVGDLIEAYGHWDHHETYGWQFKATRAAQVVGGTLQALRAFLTRLPNVGRQRAYDIIQHFGSDRQAVLDAIEHAPQKLTAIAGITPERADEIQQAYLEAGDLREVSIWLAGLQLGEATTANILDEWGTQARQVLEENPYNLMELSRIGFRRADELALGRFKIHGHDPRRAAAAVLFLLQEEEDEGHTWANLHDLVGYPPAEGI